MKCKVTALVMASLLAIGSTAAFAADTIPDTAQPPGNERRAMTRIPGQHHMFDGVSLSEQQRQQMRDLMRQARHDLPGVNVAEMEAMHKLVTAEKFDEAAVYARRKRWPNSRSSARSRWPGCVTKCAQLLTPEQKSVLDQKHQQRMQQMEQQISGCSKLLPRSEVRLSSPCFSCHRHHPCLPRHDGGFFLSDISLY
ncbi:Spy/CpxP family protein refolding chaperone [Serratia ureilytica]